MEFRPWAYPRVCGATLPLQAGGEGDMGLSPRVRGNRNLSENRMGNTGPIPACAGQPAENPRRSHDEGAYPRVCGATFPLEFGSRLYWGLSPRVRGNPERQTHGPMTPRPIPACAGQPPMPAKRMWTLRAYPRVCGATFRSFSCTIPAMGLSPRVRGNLSVFNARKQRNGPIPACAGQPCHGKDP